MSEDRPSPSSVHCPLSVCQPGPFVRPLNKEGTAHNESQYWQANSNACNDRGQRRRLIRAERQPQSQGSIRWTLDGGRWTWDLKIGGQRWGDQVKRNKSSRPVAESHNDWQSKRRTDRSTILHTSTITYGTRRSSIVDRRNVVVADRWSWIGLLPRLLPLLPCIIVNQMERLWRGWRPPFKGCSRKVVKGLSTLENKLAKSGLVFGVVHCYVKQ